MALAVVVVVLVVWFMTPSRSPLALLELQLLWLAPAILWTGVALAVSRKGRRKHDAPRRTIVAVVLFSLWFALATLLSWFASIGAVRMILLSPRPVDWGPIQVLPIGEWLELFLTGLTSFHGRVVDWSWNRLVLIVLGLLLWTRAVRRAGRANAGTSETHPARELATTARRLALPALALGIALPVAAAMWPSSCTDWRLGWCEARLDVLADPANPELGTLSISYMTHPALGSDEPKGTLVAASGGPAAASSDQSLFLDALGEIADDYDILISDYRGFGRSSYVGCPGLDIGVDDKAAVEDCQERLGPLASLMSGRHAAADLEAIRTELGLGEVSIYGESYGTYFAQAYAMAYPDSVRAMVLDSTLPLHTGDWVFNLKEPMPGVAPDGTVTGPAAEWAELVEDVRAGGGTSPSVDDLAVIHLHRTWPEIAEARDRAMERSGEERLAALADLSEQLRTQLSAMRNDPTLAILPPQASAIYGCNDYVMPFPKDAGLAEREQATREFARASYGASVVPFTWEEINEAQAGVNGLRVDGFVHQQCLYWDYPAGAGTPDPEVPDVPVLLLSGTLDDATTPAMSRDVEELWNASIVTVVDGDHFVLWDTDRDCAREAASRFLADPEHHAPLECAAGE
ncbi:alpha/beta fold hydrolase [Salana multivorans]